MARLITSPFVYSRSHSSSSITNHSSCLFLFIDIFIYMLLYKCTKGSTHVFLSVGYLDTDGSIRVRDTREHQAHYYCTMKEEDEKVNGQVLLLATIPTGGLPLFFNCVQTLVRPFHSKEKRRKKSVLLHRFFFDWPAACFFFSTGRCITWWTCAV